MAFKDVFNFKQAVLKEIEAMGYSIAAEKPTSFNGTDEQFIDWTKYYMYRYYKDLFNNSIDLGTVVLSKEDIFNFYNATQSQILRLTDSVNIELWEKNDDFLPYLELVSLPTLNENGSIQSAGHHIANEKSGSDYVLCYKDLYNPYPLIEKGEEEYTVNAYGLYGRGNIGQYSGGGVGGLGTPNTSKLNQSTIHKKDLDTAGAWESVKTTMLAYGGFDKWFTFIPLDPIDDWRGSYRQNEQWLFKGKNPNREKDTFRDLFFYRKFEYTNDEGERLGYRYIPLTPFLEQVLSGNTMTQSNRLSWQLGFKNNNNYPSIGYQPFNYNIIFDLHKNSDFTNGYLMSLPGITYTQSESLNIIIFNVDDFSLLYGPYQLWMQYYELGQYFYLCDIKFETDEEKAASLPYTQLFGGFPPEIESGGGGEGETAGPSGTTSGGNKEDISGVGGSISEDTVLRHYPVSDHLLEPGFYGGVYIPSYRYIMEITDNSASNDAKVKEMNTIISNTVRQGKGDSIVESFITYSGFINSNGYDEIDGSYYDYRYFLPGISIYLERPVYLCGYNSSDPNTYIPKNNKLLTYPYLSFEINGYGQRNELKLENWSTEKPKVLICSKFLPGSSIFVFPQNYEGVKNNYDAGVAGQPLPIMPYTIDKYKNEYEASVNSRTAAVTSLIETSTMQGLSAVLNAGLGVSGSSVNEINMAGFKNTGKHSATYSEASGKDMAKNIIQGYQGVSGALLSTHQGLREFEAQLKDVENRPLAIANQNAAPSLPALNSNSAAPYIVWKSIRKEFAQKIDDFFTRYGYKVSKYKEVDIHTRPVFNFLKCSQARVEGSIPNEDLMQIKTILEKGITFWHDPSKILDYSVENPAPKNDAPVYLNPSYNK